MSNITATQQLKALYSKSEKHNKYDSKSVINDAFQIYDNIKESKNHYVINTFLKVCYYYNTPETVLLIWNDIKTIDNISYPLLLKCLVKMNKNEFNMNKCIEILKWIKNTDQNYNKFEIIDYSMSVSQLLSKCRNNKQLQIIYDLIKDNNNDIFIKTALINAYKKYSYSNDVNIAWNIFNSIHETKKDVVVIGAMMQLLMNNNQNQDALQLYLKYYHLNNDISHIIAIKACINMNDFERGKQIYSKIANKKHCIELNNALIDFYGYFGDIDNALNIFNSIEHRNKDIVSISTMIKCFMNNGYNDKALELYNKYNQLHLTNDICHMLAIKACIKLNDFEMGQQIYSQIKGKQISVQLKNALIDLYGKFGDIKEAINIFNSIHDKDKDTVNLNGIMTVLINNKTDNKAIYLYDQYERLHDDISHLLAIKGCINIDNGLEKGQNIHNKLLKVNGIQTVKLKTGLIHFYGIYNKINKAMDVFESITNSEKDTVAINSMMTAFVNNEHYNKALDVYQKYYSLRNDISHLLAIKATMNMKDYDKGKQIYSNIERKKNKQQSIELLTTMIDFYGECNDIDNAERMYGYISENEKNVVSINALMKAYVNNHYNDKSLLLYQEYRSLINSVSHIFALKACINLYNLEKGEEIITNIMKNSNQFNNNIELQATMIEFYGYFNNINKALQIFNCIKDNDKNIMIINAMLNAYCHCKMSKECIKFFENIQIKYPKITPNIISYVLVLKGCTQSTSVYFGKKIHEEMKKNKKEWLLYSKEIQMSLITFYGKCGMLNCCRDIFDGIDKIYKYKDTEVWNVMIHAFGRNNDIIGCKQIFNEMINDYNLMPDTWTYRKLINACSHSGDVEVAYNIWNDIDDENIKYDSYVITTLIDCFSRKGMLNKAKQIWLEYERNKSIKNHPNDKKMLMALMSGCSRYKNSEVGKEIYMEIKNRADDINNNMNNDNVSAAFVLLSNIHSSEHYEIK